MEEKNNPIKPLDRYLFPIDVWGIAFGCMVGWGVFAMPGTTFLPVAGPAGTLIAMLVSLLIMLVIARNFHYLLGRSSMTGGIHSYAKEAFGRDHAFICSWFLGLSYLAIVPLNATALALIGRNLMNNIFQVGFHYSVAGYDIYMGEIILAEAALLLFAFLSIRGVKFAGVFQTGLVFALVGGVLIVTIAAILNPQVKFSNLQPSFAPGLSRVGGVLAVVAVAPWAFVGFDTIPQAAEEFQFSPRKTKSIMVLSIMFGAAVYVILNTVTAAVIPSGYVTWSDYIADLPNLEGVLSLPTFHAGQQLLGRWGLLFLGLAVLGAILSGIIGFYMATSRLLYSMSKEKVLPAWFGKLDARFKTPSNAILFVLVIALAAPFFGRTALGWIVDMSSIGAAIGYGYTSLAAYRFASRERNFGVMFTGIIGSIMALIFMILLLVPIPMFNCSLGRESYICLIIWIIMGVIFYIRSGK